MSELAEKLFSKKDNSFGCATEEELALMFSYADGYKKFLNVAKTEREAVRAAVKLAEEHGYKPFRFGDTVRPGDQLYYNNRGKNLFLIRVGSAPIETAGVKILAAHIDSPRLDLKQCPVYEDSQMCFLKTHYYGGIKKYQWTAIPLALHGTIVRADGEEITVCVGEDENDPIFYINDLLPHLAQKQSREPLAEAIPGEALNVLVGGMPVAG